MATPVSLHLPKLTLISLAISGHPRSMTRSRLLDVKTENGGSVEDLSLAKNIDYVHLAYLLATTDAIDNCFMSVDLIGQIAVLLQYNRDLIYYTNNNITKLPLVLC
jgi:hypothetical protein